MKIITSGKPYIDIDAYAGIISYAELLNLQGQPAIAYSSSVPNESVPPAILAWKTPLVTEYVLQPGDTFALVDISSPDQFDPLVEVERVATVIDHHTGHEQFWLEKLGPDHAHIEFVGSACTLIYELWRDSGLLGQISELSARLMIAAILDNTLNFKAHLTLQRDHDAHQALLSLAHLPQDWAATYFSQCQEVITENLERAIRNDTKVVDKPIIPHYPTCFGQLVVWDAQPVLAQLPTIRSTLAGMKADWAMNLVSIHEGKSYFIADDPDVQAALANITGVSFDESLAQADRLWLRKEIVKQAAMFSNKF
ncbi:MAG TPA: DHH family phosphoesterase [Candidatus Acidoferrum sp.]|nr:DHH family phosphoesterase [Candidatus Acidoferrum sp.]